MKFKHLKKVVSVLLSAALIATLFGCSSSLDEGNGNNASQSEENAEGIDMTFWIFLDPNSTEDPRSVVLSEIVEEYNETNEYGNTVTVESFNYSEFEAQAIQAAAAGTGPDIINCFSDQLMQHIEAGTVQPMTDYASDFIDEMGDYIHTADKLTQADGEIYSLPWESRVTTLWYRLDIYDTEPASWDDLLTMSSEASTDLALGFGIGLSEDGNGAGLIETFIPWIHSAGGEFLDEDGKAVFNRMRGSGSGIIKTC